MSRYSNRKESYRSQDVDDLRRRSTYDPYRRDSSSRSSRLGGKRSLSRSPPRSSRSSKESRSPVRQRRRYRSRSLSPRDERRRSPSYSPRQRYRQRIHRSPTHRERKNAAGKKDQLPYHEKEKDRKSYTRGSEHRTRTHSSKSVDHVGNDINKRSAPLKPSSHELSPTSSPVVAKKIKSKVFQNMLPGYQVDETAVLMVVSAQVQKAFQEKLMQLNSSVPSLSGNSQGGSRHFLSTTSPSSQILKKDQNHMSISHKDWYPSRKPKFFHYKCDLKGEMVDEKSISIYRLPSYRVVYEPQLKRFNIYGPKNRVSREFADVLSGDANDPSRDPREGRKECVSQKAMMLSIPPLLPDEHDAEERDVFGSEEDSTLKASQILVVGLPEYVLEGHITHTCEKIGPTAQIQLYTHPETHESLGLASIRFVQVEDAEKFYQQFHDQWVVLSNMSIALQVQALFHGHAAHHDVSGHLTISFDDVGEEAALVYREALDAYHMTQMARREAEEKKMNPPSSITTTTSSADMYDPCQSSPEDMDLSIGDEDLKKEPKPASFARGKESVGLEKAFALLEGPPPISLYHDSLFTALRSYGCSNLTILPSQGCWEVTFPSVALRDQAVTSIPSKLSGMMTQLRPLPSRLSQPQPQQQLIEKPKEEKSSLNSITTCQKLGEKEKKDGVSSEKKPEDEAERIEKYALYLLVKELSAACHVDMMKKVVFQQAVDHVRDFCGKVHQTSSVFSATTGSSKGDNRPQTPTKLNTPFPVLPFEVAKVEKGLSSKKKIHDLPSFRVGSKVREKYGLDPVVKRESNAPDKVLAEKRKAQNALKRRRVGVSRAPRTMSDAAQQAERNEAEVRLRKELAQAAAIPPPENETQEEKIERLRLAAERSRALRRMARRREREERRNKRRLRQVQDRKDKDRLKERNESSDDEREMVLSDLEGELEAVVMKKKEKKKGKKRKSKPTPVKSDAWSSSEDEELSMVPTSQVDSDDFDMSLSSSEDEGDITGSELEEEASQLIANEMEEERQISSLSDLSLEEYVYFRRALLDPTRTFLRTPVDLEVDPEVVVAEDADEAKLALFLDENATGSARTEGFAKMDKKKQMEFRYVNTKQLAAPVVGSGNRQTSRSVRARARETSAVLQQVKESTHSTLLSYNRLRSRGKRIKFQKSHIHNWGLYAMENIQANEMVIEYIGEIVRSAVGDLREQRYERQGMGSSYMFRINAEYIIDATKKGNRARFINHSCDANCFARVINVEGEEKIVIYAKKDIAAGQEISYDYKFPIEDGSIPCLCGAATCRGTLN